MSGEERKENRGHSRKRQKESKLPVWAVVLLCIAALILVLILRKRSGNVEETEAPSVSESVSETETEEPETETPEETTEETTAEPEPDWWYYTDKSFVEQRYLPEEDAAPREYEWNIPRVDENGNTVFEQTDASFPEYEMIRGIDVSKEQGKINWYKVRDARCDFVLICADEMFSEHYDGAYQLGLRIGAYYCSEAETPEEAREEAEEFLALVGDREMDLFLAYVPEEMQIEGPYGREPSEEYFADADTARNTEIAKAFCDTVAAAGYRPAIYASMRYEAEMYDMEELSGEVEIWYSDFGGSPATPYSFSTWQYCLTGGITGVNGPVHLDVYLQRPYEETEEEQQIYTYTQFSPEAYRTTSWVNYRSVNEAWNGDWAKIAAGGQEFMMFGCGICCLSNAVSTLTGTVVDPGEMYYSTKEHTSYYPESGRGAVAWEYLKTMCGVYGLDMKLSRKPSSYQDFVNDISGAGCTVILVNGDNDRRLWWYTDGHYVSIWAYDPETDTVFVADPSTHYNRLRVKLTDVYHALKTGSNYQYGLVMKP